MIDNISCIILAAGNSRRFGSAKMHYRLANGLTILQSTVQSYSRVFDTVNVVIQSDDETLKRTLANYPVTIIESPNAQAGLSQSVIAGVQQSPPENRCVIGLGDMPFVQVNTLKRLKQGIANSKPNNIIAPSMGERLGNPVSFGSFYRKGLLALSGDIGAKSIVKSVVKSNPEALIRIEVHDQGIFWDIDTEADLPLTN